MTVFQKRTRIVSFRVSDDEYRKLQKLSRQKGAHSISDYARQLACVADGQHHQLPALAAQVTDLYTRIDQILTEIKNLTLSKQT